MKHCLIPVIVGALSAVPLGASAQEPAFDYTWQLANCFDETKTNDICKAFRNGYRVGQAVRRDPGDILDARAVVVKLDDNSDWNTVTNWSALAEKTATVSVRPDTKAAEMILGGLSVPGGAQVDGTYSVDIGKYQELIDLTDGANFTAERLEIPLTNDGNAMAAANAITDAVKSLPADLRAASRVEAAIPHSSRVIDYGRARNFQIPVPGAAIP